jgi:hypothetical protein
MSRVSSKIKHRRQPYRCFLRVINVRVHAQRYCDVLARVLRALIDFVPYISEVRDSVLIEHVEQHAHHCRCTLVTESKGQLHLITIINTALDQYGSEGAYNADFIFFVLCVDHNGLEVFFSR